MKPQSRWGSQNPRDKGCYTDTEGSVLRIQPEVLFARDEMLPDTETQGVADVAASEQRRQFREWAQRCEVQSAQSFDKTLVALGGGALALSIAFLEKIVTQPTTRTLTVLWTSWACLLLSLVMILTSMLTSVHGFRRLISQLDDGTLSRENFGGPYTAVTKWLNWGAWLTFLLGVLLLLIFAGLNYPRGGSP